MVKIAAGGNLSAIIDSTGDVYVFGDNSKEQIEEFKYNYDEFGQTILPALNMCVSQPSKSTNNRKCCKSRMFANWNSSTKNRWKCSKNNKICKTSKCTKNCNSKLQKW